MSDADVAIRLERASLRYRVPIERFSTLKEQLIRQVQGRAGSREVWALRDVDLCVPRGDVLGVIGQNGAGKSSLLRLLAGVIPPTSGRVWLDGWPVTPLLELGAGFHPDLTGRENVYLNATLLGHSKRETDERYDAIVDFAELPAVMDAPIRTYSSGMVVRLGFAVATAWDPRILLVDEVLAVGDEAFRRKCEGRIASFRESGVTVVLVSHDLALVAQTCGEALWLEDGRARAIGAAGEVTSAYHDASQ